jgi:hypothetical protein
MSLFIEGEETPEAARDIFTRFMVDCDTEERHGAIFVAFPCEVVNEAKEDPGPIPRSACSGNVINDSAILRVTRNALIGEDEELKQEEDDEAYEELHSEECGKKSTNFCGDDNGNRFAAEPVSQRRIFVPSVTVVHPQGLLDVRTYTSGAHSTLRSALLAIIRTIQSLDLFDKTAMIAAQVSMPHHVSVQMSHRF